MRYFLPYANKHKKNIFRSLCKIFMSTFCVRINLIVTEEIEEGSPGASYRKSKSIRIFISKASFKFKNLLEIFTSCVKDGLKTAWIWGKKNYVHILYYGKDLKKNIYWIFTVMRYLNITHWKDFFFI